MYLLGDYIPLTPLPIALDMVTLLLAFTLGLIGYIKQIGAWVFFGILVIILGGTHLMPENGSFIIILGIAGVTLGAVIGFSMFEPKVYYKHSTRARRSWSPNLNSGPSGFEDVESDLNEQATEAPGDEEPHSASEAQTETKDYYGRLGVARNSGFREIQVAYRSEMKKCHPDLFPGDKEKEEMAKEVNEAFDVLGNDQKRAAYDRYGFVA